LRSGLRHRIRNRAHTKGTFELKLTENQVIGTRHGNWYMRFVGNWFRITQIGMAPNRNDLELCKDEDGNIFPHVIGKPAPRRVVSRCRVQGDLMSVDLETGIRSWNDLGTMEGDTRRMILAMLRQQDPGIMSKEGMTVRDWVLKLEGEIEV
jgi:hypothetical protein